MTPTYVLGCEEFPKRKEATLAHLRERGVQATFWRSVAGRSWGLETLREYDKGYRISPGHVGLCLGAWNLWQHLWLTLPDGGEVVVFEDDVVLSTSWKSEFRILHMELEEYFPDWQLVFLGLAETEPHVWQKVTERIGGPHSRLCRMNDPFGTHALLLRKSALSVLLDNMAVAERNLDQQLWKRVLSKKALQWCAVLPSLVHQRTYDHNLKGKPEWAPSTLDENRPDTPERAAAEQVRDREEQARRNKPHDGDDTPGKPSARTYELTVSRVDPFPCIFRGEFLEEFGQDTEGRSVVLNTCARLGVPCHSRGRALVTAQSGPVTPCQTCTIRTEMPVPDQKRSRLPLPEGHFNPSMAVYQGQLILATRDSWGHSKVGLWKLTNEKEDWTGEWKCHPISSLSSRHIDATRLEDPRLFVHQDRLHAMFNLPDKYPPKIVQVGYVRFSADLSRIEDTVVFESPQGNLYEKNWVPISAEDEIHWVYQTKPDHVILKHGWPVWSTPNQFPWAGGVIRGGATPVKVWSDEHPRGVYYHFFHGCIKRLQGSVYTLGCTVFEPTPPYRILRQTPKLLAWPDLPAHGEDVVKRYVLWPGGAVPHAGAWHIACGVDDSFCRIMRIPFEEVERALSDRPEAVTGVTIRNTPMAKGSRDERF